MSNVDFGESQKTGAFSRTYQSPEIKGTPGLLIKWGIAKDSKTAELIMLGTSLFFLGIAVFLIYSNFIGLNSVEPVSLEEVKQKQIERIPENLSPTAKQKQIEKINNRLK